LEGKGPRAGGRRRLCHLLLGPVVVSQSGGSQELPGSPLVSSLSGRKSPGQECMPRPQVNRRRPQSATKPTRTERPYPLAGPSPKSLGAQLASRWQMSGERGHAWCQHAQAVEKGNFSKKGWWATLTSRAKNCHCERSEAIASFTLRLLRFARNDMSLIRKIRYQLAWDTTQVSTEGRNLVLRGRYHQRMLNTSRNSRKPRRSQRSQSSRREKFSALR